MPAIIEWPKGINKFRSTKFPAGTADIFPTIAEIAGLPDSSMQQPQDGQSLLQLMNKEIGPRKKPLIFRSRARMAIIDNDWKIISQPRGDRRKIELFNLAEDPSESNDLFEPHHDQVTRLRKTLVDARTSIDRSVQGKDYPEGKVLPQPPRIFWTEVPAYKKYFKAWKDRPEYREQTKKDKMNNLFKFSAAFPLLFFSLRTEAESRPNIIFLFTDDQSSYSLGCYGNKDVQTPHIDDLSLSGMTFDHHYDTTAICMASRVNAMTGLYEYRHGCNFRPRPVDRETLEDLLSHPPPRGWLSDGFCRQIRLRSSERHGQRTEVFAERGFRQMGRRARSNQLRHRQKPEHESLRREVPPTPRDHTVRSVVTSSRNRPRRASPSVSRSVSRHPTSQTNRILFSTRYMRAKNSPSHSIMDGSTGSTFPFKANRAGNTNDSSAGGTVTNTTRSWQPTIKWYTVWMRPLA